MTERRVDKTAVVVIETPDSFVLQKRPDLPGKLAYPGKLQFLGGGVEAGEDGLSAAVREVLHEETTLELPDETISYYDEREFEGRDKHDRLVSRHVTIGYLGLTALGDERLKLSEQGELVRIGKNSEALAAYEDELTPFAKQVLTEFIKNKAS